MKSLSRVQSDIVNCYIDGITSQGKLRKSQEPLLGIGMEWKSRTICPAVVIESVGKLTAIEFCGCVVMGYDPEIDMPMQDIIDTYTYLIH